MSRDYFIHDALGKRRVNEQELPLPIGGKSHAGIVLPGVEDGSLFAFIALSAGHAYIQPAGNANTLFHNNERLRESAWLKSGDRLQIDDVLLHWDVKGDRVLIEVLRQAEMPEPRPPQEAPPQTPRPRSNGLPVHAENTADGDRRRRGKIVFTLIGLLLLAAIYLMMSTAVVIKVVPQPAELTMKGFPPPLTLWGSRLALPGQYTVAATLPGYSALEEVVEITKGGSSKLSFAMTELPGLLTIKVNPDVPIQLYVDGETAAFDKQGNAKIPRGSHQLRIETDRYLSHQQAIEIQGFGKLQQLDVDLQPAWAAVALASLPNAAEVLIDGEFVGRTPLSQELLQGSYEITLRKQGFSPVSFNHTVEAGVDIILESIQLQPAEGHLQITSVPTGASILLDDEYQGVTPLSLKLASNTEHKLRVSKAGYSTHEETVTVEPEQEHAIAVELSPEYGTVFLTARPAGVELAIDGKKLATGNGRLRLTTRPHVLTVSKSGYISEKLTLTPRHGISQNVSVTLKPARQAGERRAVKAAATITTANGQQLQLVRPQAILTMGASRREAGRRANESQRLVQLQRPFYFGRKEVSNGEFRQFRPAHDSGKQDGASLNSDAQPVVNISWDDAARYCNWLSKQQGLPAAYVERAGKMVAVTPMNTGYRLPTEAEWAWVARRQGQQTEQRYAWQGRFPPTGIHGNYADAQIADTLANVVPGYDDGFRGTAPVASFSQWPPGFYDLGGNVAEWVHDYYAVYPAQEKKQVTDPLGPVSGVHHVVRGASWRHGNITELRLSYRDYSNKPRYDLGFRIARYAE